MIEQVYCPRCDATTTWDNADEGSLVTRCTGCGISRSSTLTADEHVRALRRFEGTRSTLERPRRPRTWRWV